MALRGLNPKAAASWCGGVRFLWAVFVVATSYVCGCVNEKLFCDRFV